MSVPDDSRRPGCFYRGTNENRLRIAVPEWLQHFVPVQQIKVDLVQSDFGIEMQSRRQRLVG